MRIFFPTSPSEFLSFSNRSFSIVKAHGFLEPPFNSLQHLIGMIWTEFVEAIQEDRNSNKILTCKELVDVLIRIYTICGYLQIELDDVKYTQHLRLEDCQKTLPSFFNSVLSLFYSSLFAHPLIKKLVNLEYQVRKYLFLNYPDFNVSEQIEIKLSYNESRPFKHNKLY